MKKVVTEITYICEGCGVEAKDKLPRRPGDSWGKVMVDQPWGYCHHGSPWVPRMRDPKQLCGRCIEQVMKTINGLGEAEDV